MHRPIATGGLLVVLALLVASCASSRYGDAGGPRPTPQRYVKDNRPRVWSAHHPRVQYFVRHYRDSRTVQVALERARRYLPWILPEFRRRRLPLQLAYLPMLESMFDPRADSGHARGLWQFTPETARHMGLTVSRWTDERTDVRKATRAAAEYLDELGEMFNYNWGLALAAYNGGPGYIAKQMRRQHTWHFYELRLRRETAEYVPRFVAMLLVAREQYPHLLAADLRRALPASDTSG